MIKKIKKILEKENIDFTLHKVPEGVGESVAEHIKAFGLDFSDGCSTLIYSTDKGFIALLRRDDSRVNSKELKKQLGLKSLRMATAEELKKETGFNIGLVSPIPLAIPIYYDSLLEKKEYVRVGTGGNEYSLEIKTSDLIKLKKAKKVDVGEISRDVERNLSDMIVLSGINPSSSKGLHLGNYLGAGKQHVEMQQNAKKAYYFIADYHSLNSVFDSQVVRSNVYNTYLDYLSFGLDPEDEDVVFFVESGVTEICELNIILNNVVSMAELKRMHAYKDKFSDGVNEDSINHGLFNYPVLMASDILAFKSDIVPVGEDQSQHVEITRAIAKHFNAKYGEVLNIPELLVKEETGRVIGIDGERKMSKSLGNHLPIFASEDEVRKQIFAITTDTNRIHPTDPGDPDKNPIFEYMKYLEYDVERRQEFIDRYRKGTVGDVEIKKEFLRFYLEYFGEMRSRRESLAKDSDKIKSMIEKNNHEAQKVAKETLSKVRKAVGLE